MAKNWKVGEAVRTLNSDDKASIMDIGRRFPLFAKLAVQTNEAGMAILDCIPDYVSARKIEAVLKGDVQPNEAGDEAEAEEDEEEAPVKAKKAPAKAKAKGKYDGKTAKELYDLCKKRGITVKAKLEAEAYAEALTNADEAEAKKAATKKAPAKAPAKAKAKAEEEAEDDEDWDEEEAEPAKPAKAKKAPAKKEAEAEDDDWDI